MPYTGVGPAGRSLDLSFAKFRACTTRGTFPSSSQACTQTTTPGVVQVLDMEPLDEDEAERHRSVQESIEGGVEAYVAFHAGHKVRAGVALNAAVAAGQAGVVAVLLADGLADPAANASVALRYAANAGLVPVVDALLADGRADPAAHDSEALRAAAANAHANVVAALLADGRADPAACTSVAVLNAALNGYADVVQALLDDGRVNVSAVDVAKWPILQCAVRWQLRRAWLRSCVTRDTM
jgi:hypothetical protein